MNFHINSQKFTHFLLIRLSCVRDTHIIFMRIDQANWVRESLKWNCLDLAKKHFWAPLNWMLHTHTHKFIENDDDVFIFSIYGKTPALQRWKIRCKAWKNTNQNSSENKSLKIPLANIQSWSPLLLYSYVNFLWRTMRHGAFLVS